MVGGHGFSEVAPDTGQVRPISALSRTTKAMPNAEAVRQAVEAKS